VTATVRWTIVIFGLLIGNLVAMAILIVSAKVSGAQVIPEYYERAVQYDHEIDGAARSRELAWRVQATLEQAAIEVDVRDASNAPIANARVVVRGFHRARASARFEHVLQPRAPGRYAIGRANEVGVHDLEIVVERGDARFVAHRVVELR
jgi:nitrogen fixation protein FixH